MHYWIRTREGAKGDKDLPVASPPERCEGYARSRQGFCCKQKTDESRLPLQRHGFAVSFAIPHG
ncbi:MAG: hypothetical protein PHC84_04140 [Clostridia bacterium]|nr:hypothetical protein [Clostridia bacterium]